MGQFVSGENIGAAWLAAFSAIDAAKGSVVNLAVDIANPMEEDLGVRSAIEHMLVELRAQTTGGLRNVHSVHTVANTIFPISLYRPEIDGAAERFFMNAIRSERGRSHAKRRSWGTYLGRLVQYPSHDGTATNQLREMLDQLRSTKHWSDLYEMPIVSPRDENEACWETAPPQSSAVLHADARTDARMRGGPCLAHISLTLADGRVSMLALYRRHSYIARAYGNFLGLARLQAFLARESGHGVGNLMVVTGHAVDDGPRRSDLLREARAAVGVPSKIEVSSRPLGASWSDLDLPMVKR